MVLQLYDTYARSLRDFNPLNPPKVGLYTCGPTVYNYAHIGNLRTYIFEDILRRVLEFNGYEVNHVTNITDVGHLTSDADVGEDKMEEGSKRTGKSAWEIAELYTQAFKDDLNLLNILEPTVWCRATDHIQEQIDFIKCIEARGFTYATSDGIYFDTSRLQGYGYLARLDVEGLQAGARVDIAEKRNPTDFALWKFSPSDQKRQMEWESPWGVGFPGWHIECSAMSAKYLGAFFDIHCGGEDHIPVHHTNEIAQTQACHGTNLANFWLHGYFLQFDQARMAKSSSEFLRLPALMERGYDPLAYRYFCLNAHHRAKLNFTWESLDGAAKAFNRLRTLNYEWGQAGAPDEKYVERFAAHINNDLNMPRAVALTWELVKSDLPASTKKATLGKFDEVLGLRLAEWRPPEEVAPAEIIVLAEQRQQARAEKRWPEADALRDKIIAAGYEVADTPQGPHLRPKNSRPSSSSEPGKAGNLASQIDADIRALPAPNTAAVRAVRREYSRKLKQAEPAFMIELAEELIEKYGQRWAAYELIRYHPAAFQRLGEVEIEEFGQGINSWDTVDAFARILAGPAWLKGQIPDAFIHKWAASEDLWQRRAALVSTVALNVRSQGGQGDTARTLAVCRLLVSDREDMVVKAMSWALRELVVHDPEAVGDFLTEYEAELPARVKREVRNKLTSGLKNPKMKTG